MAVVNQKPQLRVNWPLVVGGLTALMLVLVALVGPTLAPRDPLKQTLVAEIGGVRRAAPFPPFVGTDFPLGSDQFGRDTLSRLLWAVRPTLLLVVIVASIRLVLGYLVGIIAGWSNRWPGRVASGLLSAATATPVLVVALAAIVAVGIERGLPAFVVGMALTGWADTAQSIRAQTAAVRVQLYVESARAMGASSLHIVVRHVVRHVLPLVGVLFAFEISATLMLTATLGFLGYYIGGGIWIITSGDFIPIAQRAAGLPELGQMVATSLVRFGSRPPWQMIFPGLVIFLAILGFVLLGEGLRRRQNLLAPAPAGPIGRRVRQVGRGLETGLLGLAARWNRRATRAVALTLGLLGLALGSVWWQSQPAATVEESRQAGPIAAGRGWPGARGDVSGTLWSLSGPVQGTVAWSFRNGAGLAGGPVLAADGTIYLAGRSGVLHALDGQGAERWQVTLTHEPSGGPALAADGTIYVADRAGGLSAISPAGEIQWRMQSHFRAEATSGPIVGPDGTIYYTVVDGVQAVAQDGTERWANADPALAVVEQAPRLSPAADLIFLKTAIFRAADGALLRIPIATDEKSFNDPSYLVGADGFSYYRSGHNLTRWRQVEAGLALGAALTWAYEGSVLFLPTDAGVRPDGTAWLLYSASYADTRVVWINQEGRVVGNTFFPLTNGRAIAAAGDTLYVCGSARNRALECLAIDPGSDEPSWQVGLEPAAVATGGALADGRLYITTDQGSLFVLGQ